MLDGNRPSWVKPLVAICHHTGEYNARSDGASVWIKLKMR